MLASVRVTPVARAVKPLEGFALAGVELKPQAPRIDAARQISVADALLGLRVVTLSETHQATQQSRRAASCCVVRRRRASQRVASTVASLS
jgi:hypothetical protein